jgi:hypothetical protein
MTSTRLSPHLSRALLAPLVVLTLHGLSLAWWAIVPLTAVTLWLLARLGAFDGADGVADGWPARLLLLLGIAQAIRLTIYMWNGEHTSWALPLGDRAYHTNLGGYYIAAFDAARRIGNIYDDSSWVVPAGFPGDGPYHLTTYQYPPPFLLLPWAVYHAIPDFVRMRAAWCGIGAFGFVAAAYLAARRVAGPHPDGLARVLWPLVFCATATQVLMQFGNFQLLTFAAVLLAFEAFERGRRPIGGAALAFVSLSKIFPAALMLLLVGRRQWRELAWTIGFALLFVVLTLAIFSPKPFVDFVHTQLPEMRSGEAFAFLKDSPWGVGYNQAVFGIPLKLAALGVSGMGWAAAGWVANAYAVGFIGLLLYLARAAWRGELGGGPLLWLAVLHLASLRSPFVAEPQALFGTCWIACLAAPALPRVAWIGVVAVTCVIQVSQEFIFGPQWTLVWTLVVQVVALALDLWVIRHSLGRSAPTRIADEAKS